MKDATMLGSDVLQEKKKPFTIYHKVKGLTVAFSIYSRMVVLLKDIGI